MTVCGRVPDLDVHAVFVNQDFVERTTVRLLAEGYLPDCTRMSVYSALQNRSSASCTFRVVSLVCDEQHLGDDSHRKRATLRNRPPSLTLALPTRHLPLPHLIHAAAIRPQITLQVWP